MRVLLSLLLPEAWREAANGGRARGLQRCCSRFDSSVAPQPCISTQVISLLSSLAVPRPLAVHLAAVKQSWSQTVWAIWLWMASYT